MPLSPLPPGTGGTRSAALNVAKTRLHRQATTCPWPHLCLLTALFGISASLETVGAAATPAPAPLPSSSEHSQAQGFAARGKLLCVG